jgi:hypothetical protein
MHVHDYKTVGENDEAIVEVCKECKKRLVMRKDSKGRTENRQYLKEHIRDTAQPTGVTSKIFNRFYKIKK